MKIKFANDCILNKVSGIKSDHPTDWATTTGQHKKIPISYFLLPIYLLCWKIDLLFHSICIYLAFILIEKRFRIILSLKHNSLSVWSDLAKFCHFCKNSIIFGNLWAFIDKILNILWQILHDIGQAFILVPKWPNVEEMI